MLKKLLDYIMKHGKRVLRSKDKEKELEKIEKKYYNKTKKRKE